MSISMFQQREIVFATPPRMAKYQLMKVSLSYSHSLTLLFSFYIYFSLSLSLSLSAPVILEFPEDTRVEEGEGVVFRVEVAGVPHPKLTWYHDGEEVVANYSRELSEDGSLTMPSAETKLSGVYQLVARNRAGTMEREVKLQVDQEGLEDAATDDPPYETVPLTGPIPVAAFGGHVEQKHSKNNKPFKEEYEVSREYHYSFLLWCG